MYLFYTPQIELEQCLSAEESAHCVRVLRYGRGDEILLTDGKGFTYTARITNPNPRCCEFEVLTKERQEPTHQFHLHIAIAPTKNIDRLEWMVEKATEIGVDEITPLLCRYSERKQIREDRLEKIILSAAKQSLTPYLPVLNPLTEYEQFLAQHHGKGGTFIAHCYKNERYLLRDEIVALKQKWEAAEAEREIIVLIGPEGDFSEQEVSQAIAVGYKPVSLGNSRLRTETAGVVACHTAILVNE